MLDTFKNIFSIEENTGADSEVKPNPIFNRNPDFITEPKQIYRILGALKSRKALITATIPNIQESFATCLLEIDNKSEFVYFDELNPKNGHTHLLSAMKFKAATHFQGVAVTFNANDIVIGKSEGMISYRVPVPDCIFYPQRRDFHRVYIPTDYLISFSGIIATQKQSVKGRVNNISCTGIGLVLDGYTPIQTGDMFTHCQINLPEGQSIRFDLLLKFIKSPPQANQYQIGGHFQNMNAKNRKMLKQILAALERAEVKKQR